MHPGVSNQKARPGAHSADRFRPKPHAGPDGRRLDAQRVSGFGFRVLLDPSMLRV